MNTRSKPVSERVFDVLNITVLLLFGAMVAYPFLNLLALSLNDGADAARGGIYIFPRKFSLDAYVLLSQNHKLLEGFGWSVLRVIVGTSTALFVTGLLAYIVSIRHFSGRKFMRILFLVTMYFNGGLIPVYLLMVKLGLTDSFNVYWIPTLISAYFMLLMASYISELPEALFESARLDGATEITIYIRLVIPMSLPVFAAVFIYAAVGHWNSWFDVILYNSSGHFDTLQVYLRRLLLEVEASQQIMDQQLIYQKFNSLSPLTLRAATTILVTVPILLVYPFLQKYFIGGLTIGSVKG
ncbi:putative aldouronate transport system permease protein [Paenibacillus endophyticus]|uniref:Putative aldouronate transport system permease protein n=1 Tax=Paenibacillus endophyticus TaxID=1294268 RepID=A0A7W5G9F9_9BACL|nr:carbohydrate ABC transporter permease [Paenibacillus endophyticus]MBB3150927.1 putative aldouronate transport system permease protein [Paenibacillus endophyticus]